MLHVCALLLMRSCMLRTQHFGFAHLRRLGSGTTSNTISPCCSLAGLLGICLAASDMREDCAWYSAKVSKPVFAWIHAENDPESCH